jgi:hypothetical protein
MRAIHILTVLAALALGTAFAPAQAQDFILMTPPADTAGPAQPPTFEDLKAEIVTGQPPKAGSAMVFEPWPQEWRTPMKAKRATTEQIKPNR